MCTNFYFQELEWIKVLENSQNNVSSNPRGLLLLYLVLYLSSKSEMICLSLVFFKEAVY